MTSPHEWVFDVLTDLHAYAVAQGLPRLAESAAHTLDIARDEIGTGRRRESDNPGDNGPERGA